MFFKRMCRRPLLPILIMAELLSSVIFLSVNERAIMTNRESIAQLYDAAVVECQVLPKSVMGGKFAISPFDAQTLCRQDAVASYFCVLKEPCYFPENGSEGGMLVVCGTNDLSTFGQKMYVTCSLLSEYENVDFSEDIPVCLLDAAMAEDFGYGPGDIISIVGGDENGLYSDKAAPQELTVIGTYVNNGSMVEEGAILVPESRFFTRGEARLVYNGASRNRWYYYVKFSFTIDSAYNKDIDSTVAALEESVSRLSGMGEYTFHAGTRELELALRPLENKLAIQQRLSLPMKIAFITLAAVLTLLLVSGEREEILIRRLCGESGGRVMLSIWSAFCVFFLILSCPAFLLARLLQGKQELIFLLGSVAVTALSSGALLMIICRKSLVALYQSSS